MKSSLLGKNTSRVEVQNISAHGIWLYARGREYLLPFKQFPWFKSAKVSEIYNVKLVHKSHLHWPDLDVDLDIESLEHPEHFPLVAKNA
ncbi:MAG: DUF2442 domain-containing protein [Elusimicrobia bacterium]|nr:DUF2442 domain-containing protein [Elusimicrobiota bacterium]